MNVPVLRHQDCQECREFLLSTDHHPHGSNRFLRQPWAVLLRDLLPPRWGALRAVLVTASQERTPLLDLVIYDRHRGPSPFPSPAGPLLPVESVVAVFTVVPVLTPAAVRRTVRMAEQVRRLPRRFVPLFVGSLPPLLAGILALRAPAPHASLHMLAPAGPPWTSSALSPASSSSARGPAACGSPPATSGPPLCSSPGSCAASTASPSRPSIGMPIVAPVEVDHGKRDHRRLHKLLPVLRAHAAADARPARRRRRH